MILILLRDRYSGEHYPADPVEELHRRQVNIKNRFLNQLRFPLRHDNPPTEFVKLDGGLEEGGGGFVSPALRVIPGFSLIFTQKWIYQ